MRGTGVDREEQDRQDRDRGAERGVTGAGPSRQQAIEATVAEITKWWADLAAGDAATTAPKAVEYGAADLEIMGAAMQSLFPGIDAYSSAHQAAIGREMAVGFYALGKVARLFGAYQRGELPGEDCWFDLSVYSIMARRIRETGRWV